MINDLEKYASKMTKKFSKENNNITPHKIEKILEEKFNNTSHEKARELVQIWSKDLKKNIDIAYMLSRISEREKKFMFNYLGFDKINRRDLNKEFGHGAMKQADLLTKNYLLVYRRKLFHNVSLNLYENFRIKTFREEKIKISKHDYIYYLLSDLEKIEDMIRNEVIYAKTEQEDTKAQVKYIKYLIITGSLMIVFNIDTAKIWWLNTFGTKITKKLLRIDNVTNDYYEEKFQEFNRLGLFQDAAELIAENTIKQYYLVYDKNKSKLLDDAKSFVEAPISSTLWSGAQIIDMLGIREDDALRYDLVVLYPEIIQKQYETNKISKATLYRRLNGTVSIKKIQNRRQQQRFRDGKRAFKYLNKNKLILRELPKEIEKVQDELKNSQLDEKKKTAKEKQLNTKIKQLDKLNKGFKELTKKEVCENMATYKSRNANKEIESMTRPTLDKYLFEYYAVEYKRLTKQKNGKSLELTDIEHVAEYLFLKPNQLIKLIKKYNNRIKN